MGDLKFEDNFCFTLSGDLNSPIKISQHLKGKFLDQKKLVEIQFCDIDEIKSIVTDNGALCRHCGKIFKNKVTLRVHFNRCNFAKQNQ